MPDSSNLAKSVNTVVSSLMKLLEDQEFRRSLRELATTILEIVPPVKEKEEQADESVASNNEAQAVSSPTPSIEATLDLKPKKDDFEYIKNLEQLDKSIVPTVIASKPSPQIESDYRESPIPASTAIEMLHFGRGSNRYSQDTIDVSKGKFAHAESGDELALMKDRCTLKGEAARWAARRRRLSQIGADFQSEIAPIDRDIISRARNLEGCYLWTNNASCPEPADVNCFDKLGDAYENLAEALRLTETILSSNELNSFLEAALCLVAEAQSALRSACSTTGFEGNDFDQQSAFNWLREITRERSIFISRFMQTSGVEPTGSSEELSDRIAVLDTKVRESAKRRKEVRRLLGKLRFEAQMIQENRGHAMPRVNTIIRTLDELVPGMIPASNVDLRNILLPVFEHIDEVEPGNEGAKLVANEIELFLARNPTMEPENTFKIKLSDAVFTLREHLSGRSLLMIGGERRPLRQEAIRSAFELKELVWETVNPHTPLDNFSHQIARPDIAAVLLAIRWSSHSYTAVEAFCRQFDKPLVRLPGGTNANQIANQIMIQAGDRLLGEA